MPGRGFPDEREERLRRVRGVLGAQLAAGGGDVAAARLADGGGHAVLLEDAGEGAQSRR